MKHPKRAAPAIKQETVEARYMRAMAGHRGALEAGFVCDFQHTPTALKCRQSVRYDSSARGHHMARPPLEDLTHLNPPRYTKPRHK